MKIPGGGRGPGAEPSVLCAVRHVHDTATEYSHAARRACRAGAAIPIARVSPCDFDVLRILIYFVLGKRSSAPPSSTPISPDHARPRDCRADDSREYPRHR